jgi:hypothetical protein
VAQLVDPIETSKEVGQKTNFKSLKTRFWVLKNYRIKPYVAKK